MNKFSISLYFILLLGCFSTGGHAQSAAADAAALFKAASELIASYETPTDAQLVLALKSLKKMVDEGNKQLLNRKVSLAQRSAERVAIQMELVRLYARLADMKMRLNKLKTETMKKENEKVELEAQYQRLLLLQDGRMLTDAFPAPDAKEAGAE
ncbi:MAG: hypothetical protein JXR76_27400 [Deltaproteobacteria bacterium]|nr:hypothetical protein [Deltaproteobacteria bacterium]